MCIIVLKVVVYKILLLCSFILKNTSLIRVNDLVYKIKVIVLHRDACKRIQ